MTDSIEHGAQQDMLRGQLHDALRRAERAEALLRESQPAQAEDRVERACEVMHDAYEKAAVGAGWETQAASRKPWADVPEASKQTMRAAVGALLDWLDEERSRG
jgi:hypothetical protein